MLKKIDKNKKAVGSLAYEKEADVLSWELNNKTQIDYAKEFGNVVVHFSKNNIPVYIEILEATSFLAKAKDLTKVKSSLPRYAVMAGLN